MDVQRRATRRVPIGSIEIGDGNPIAIQSMTATRTTDTEATIALVRRLSEAGADLVRIAVDSRRDAEALAIVRSETDANLSVDLQENYRLAEGVAPHVDKIRYNPGHLYHHERERSWKEKVQYLADVAGANDCAIRVGVNCGSIDPAKTEGQDADDPIAPMLESAWEHCGFLDSIGFRRYCVSLKDSDPNLVIEVNERFAAERPDIPLHLGVTEAGMPPEGIIKTRIALVSLLRRGIGDTIRVSLTVPNDRKTEEIAAGQQIIEEVVSGQSTEDIGSSLTELNIISCPSCSRVENEAFIELAERIKEMTRYAQDYPITIAVMGCRVNGPGETDDADLGLWCGPNFVNLKRGEQTIGAFAYDEILDRLKIELDQLIKQRQ